jgi:hypothetical protein
MKKASKIYLWAWAAFVAAAIVAVVVAMVIPSHHDLARDPYAIERIVKVDLPEIVEVGSEDNLYRGASRWDVYTHRVQFGEALSEESIKKLDRLCHTDSQHWQKNAEEGYYRYTAEGGVDELYAIDCEIHHDHAHWDYMVDESEGILLFVAIYLCVHLMLLWGVVLLAIAVVKRIVKNRQRQ